MRPEKCLATRALVIAGLLIVFLDGGGEPKTGTPAAGWRTYRHDLDNSGFAPSTGTKPLYLPYLKRDGSIARIAASPVARPPMELWSSSPPATASWHLFEINC